MSATYMLLKQHMDEKFAKIDAALGLPIYGVAWDKSSSPLLTRTNASAGMAANAGVDNQIVQNDFDYAPIFGEMHDVVDSYGNVFTRIPKFYIRKTDGPGYKTWQVSKTRYPGFYLPWCFWDFANGVELPYIDIGKYKASLGEGSKLESKPGLHPIVSTHIVNMRIYARNNNVDGLAGYQQLDIHVYDMLQTLFYIEYATLNSQAIMQGFTTGRYSADDVATVAEASVNRIIVSNATAALYRVGQSIGIGTANSNNSVSGTPRLITAITSYDDNNTAVEFDGDPIDIAIGNILANRGWISGFSSGIAASSGSVVANDGKYPCMYRGIESPWGDIWQFVDGVNINNRQAWVTQNAADYASNVFASPYEQLGYVNADAHGYPVAMGFDPARPYAEFPVTVGGGSTTYYSDYYYQAAGQLIARVGGGWDAGAIAGVSVWPLTHSSSFAYVLLGGRLLKKSL